MEEFEKVEVEKNNKTQIDLRKPTYFEKMIKQRSRPDNKLSQRKQSFPRLMAIFTPV